MNLLNGLAVSDTGLIREEAEVISLKSQVHKCVDILIGENLSICQLANMDIFYWSVHSFGWRGEIGIKEVSEGIDILAS